MCQLCASFGKSMFRGQGLAAWLCTGDGRTSWPHLHKAAMVGSQARPGVSGACQGSLLVTQAALRTLAAHRGAALASGAGWIDVP